MAETKPHRLYTMPFANIYPHYVTKAEKKGRTREEVHTIIYWLTGYDQSELEHHLEAQTDLETLFASAKLNPLRKHIKGVVCGVRVEEIEDWLIREVRYMDKLIDELAKGKTMEKILRSEQQP